MNRSDAANRPDIPATGEADQSPLRIRGLETAIGQQIVHEGLDLDVMSGEILGLVGGSGSGKSLLLDEPTAGLDPIMAAQIDRLVRVLADTLGLTVVLVTHDLDTLYSTCDRVAALGDGRIIAVAPLGELEKNDDPWLCAYLHGARSRVGIPPSSKRMATLSGS